MNGRFSCQSKSFELLDIELNSVIIWLFIQLWLFWPITWFELVHQMKGDLLMVIFNICESFSNQWWCQQNRMLIKQQLTFSAGLWICTKWFLIQPPPSLSLFDSLCPPTLCRRSGIWGQTVTWRTYFQRRPFFKSSFDNSLSSHLPLVTVRMFWPW